MPGPRSSYLGDIVPGFPMFCLERWQSLHETSARVLLSESGVEPPSWQELRDAGLEPRVEDIDLGYGWTKGWPPLRRTIAERIYGSAIGVDNVVVASGGAEANLLAVLATVKPGDLVVVDTPNYMQVHGLLAMRGTRVYRLKRRAINKWRLNIEDLVVLVETLRPRAVFVTNPNNPTGAVEHRLGELAEAAARRGTVLVFDEVYRGLELVDENVTPSILSWAVEYGADAVSTGSLSKTYGLPGLRVGWAAASTRNLADRLWSVKDYTTIATSRISEILARDALEKLGEWLRQRARRIARRNAEAAARILAGCGHGLHRPEAGAFALLEIGGNTLQLAETLYQHYGILVNPGECFGELRGYLRIGLGIADPEKAERSYQQLRRALEESKAC